MKISLSAPQEYAFNNEYDDPKHEFRSKFERDRDRIIYSKNFRRLEGKTQIFLSTSHDHVRNRLTHTLEVSQIARTIARHLNIDEILTEAISLGHDLGHTPFGHVGERTLHEIMNGCDDIFPKTMTMPENIKGFKHNLVAAHASRPTVLTPFDHLSFLPLVG